MAVNIGILYAISVFKRSLLSRFCSTFPFWSCTGYAHGHLINFAYLPAAGKIRILMLERGDLSCSQYFSCFTFMVETGDDYLVNLMVVSKTTKCRDFTVIFPVFSNMHRDFADFLP